VAFAGDGNGAPPLLPPICPPRSWVNGRQDRGGGYYATKCVRCQRCFWRPWCQRYASEALKRCRCCRLFVCSWCRRTDVDGCRDRCDGPTPPPVSRKRCRADDARRFLEGEDDRRAMSLRSAAAPSPDASMVRLLAVAKQYLAAGLPLENEEQGLPPENEPWDAFEGESGGEH